MEIGEFLRAVPDATLMVLFILIPALSFFAHREFQRGKRFLVRPPQSLATRPV